MIFLKAKHNVTLHQQKQIKVIDEIEKQVERKFLQFSIVSPINDYENDSRMSLTSVHFPKEKLLEIMYQLFIEPLRMIDPHHYYYSNDSLHMTIKNIKVIHDPPQFTSKDINIAKHIFQEVIAKHCKFNIYFYRLMLFPHNLSLIGTTDPELDTIVLDLDTRLKNAGIPDDKKYINIRFFFSNITLARFTSPVSHTFIEKVNELSRNVNIMPYEVDSISLLSCNAVLKKRNIFGSWKLK